MASQLTANRRQFAWRFSLRFMLIATAAVAMSLAIWTGRASRQRSVVEDLRKLPYVSVHYDYEGTRWQATRGRPFSGSKLLGVDYFHNATWVMVFDAGEADAALPLLKRLPHLRRVNVAVDHLDDVDAIGDKFIRHLPGITIEYKPAP